MCDNTTLCVERLSHIEVSYINLKKQDFFEYLSEGITGRRLSQEYKERFWAFLINAHPSETVRLPRKVRDLDEDYAKYEDLLEDPDSEAFEEFKDWALKWMDSFQRQTGLQPEKTWKQQRLEELQTKADRLYSEACRAADARYQQTAELLDRQKCEAQSRLAQEKREYEEERDRHYAVIKEMLKDSDSEDE